MGRDKRLVKELLAIGRKIDKCSLVIGEGGNISARMGDRVYIKRRNASMAVARAADYIAIDVNTGKPLSSKGLPSTEVPMHLACYGARKDIGAVIHTHPVFVTTLGVSGINFDSLSYEAQVYLKSDIAAIPYITPGSRKLGAAVGSAIKKHNAVILKQHGLITVGKDIKEAFLRTLALERAAMIYIFCKVLGKNL
ncbi:MAG: class II aldolase/adducin family protein [Candidatus Omnitrophica bacterium]|nr:class II aldolase/adducin family protein [Candidatus Omnitrophota bacterium]